ncbi:hypothetical protein SprV_0100231200 [Sparganum proliferum]
MGTQHSSPDSMVCADAGVEVTKDSQLIRLRQSHQEGMQVLVLSGPSGVRSGHRESVDADDVRGFASLERDAQAHQAIVDFLRQTGQSSHHAIPDGKGDSLLPSLCLRAAAPEEGVVGTHLLHLSLFGEPSLSECSNVYLVALRFPSH